MFLCVAHFKIGKIVPKSTSTLFLQYDFCEFEDRQFNFTNRKALALILCSIVYFEASIQLLEYAVPKISSTAEFSSTRLCHQILTRPSNYLNNSDTN